jgi:hypothetical protein
MQLRGPAENGTYAYMFRPSLSSKLNLGPRMQTTDYYESPLCWYVSTRAVKRRCVCGPSPVPLRPERVGVLAPDLGVVVRGHDEHRDLQALGQDMALDGDVWMAFIDRIESRR